MKKPGISVRQNRTWANYIGPVMQFFRSGKFTPRIRRVKLADCMNYPDLYAAIFDEREDGIIITDFMTPEEVSNFRKNLPVCKEQYPELVEIIDNGYTFGKTFFDIPELEAYKDLIPAYESIEMELFGFSFKERLLRVIHQLAPHTPAKIADFPDGSPYLSNTIRVLTPGNGGLYFHADLNIHESAPEAEPILSIIDRTNLLSFFVMLQQPEKGGRLLLYDALYHQTPPAVYAPGPDKFDRIRKYIEQQAVHAVDMDPGSLILFNAGTRWHAIEPIEGNIPRITAGCFHGYAADHSTILVWS